MQFVGSWVISVDHRMAVRYLRCLVAPIKYDVRAKQVEEWVRVLLTFIASILFLS